MRSVCPAYGGQGNRGSNELGRPNIVPARALISARIPGVMTWVHLEGLNLHMKVFIRLVDVDMDVEA